MFFLVVHISLTFIKICIVYKTVHFSITVAVFVYKWRNISILCSLERNSYIMGRSNLTWAFVSYSWKLVKKNQLYLLN